MAIVTPSVFTVIQSYGGMKEAYFEVAEATAADTIEFTGHEVAGATLCVLQNDGANVGAAISGDDDNIVTVGTGPSADKLVGRILYKEYL